MEPGDLAELGAPAFWARLLLGALATWRVTHLLALEDGPGGSVLTLRKRLGNTWLGRAMDCFQCLSIWVAMPFALWIQHDWQGWQGWLGWLVSTLALSGAACVIEQATGAHPP